MFSVPPLPDGCVSLVGSLPEDSVRYLMLFLSQVMKNMSEEGNKKRGHEEMANNEEEESTEEEEVEAMVCTCNIEIQ